MCDAAVVADSLIRDHLLAKGYTNTFRSFEQDVKLDKDSRLQVDAFVEETLTSIEKTDIDRLRELWSTWSSKVFSRLSGERVRLARQYETEVYRLFLVKCYQLKDLAKCSEFFRKMSAHTQNNPAWTEWFAFPYNPNPQETAPFRKYFDKSWREIFIISLHNFLSIAVHVAANTELTNMVACMRIDNEASSTSTVVHEDLLDDFAVIAQCSGPMKTSQSKPSLKAILKNLTIGGKKSTE